MGNFNIHRLDAPLGALYAGVVPQVNLSVLLAAGVVYHVKHGVLLAAADPVGLLVAPFVLGVAINIIVASVAEGRPVVVQKNLSTC